VRFANLEKKDVMANFTPTQGRYLAFIHAYITQYGCPPAESDIAAAMCVSPPSVNQMVKQMEKKGLILRHPGQPRSLQLLVPEDEIPPWNNRKQAKSPVRTGNQPIRVAATPAAPPANLYVLSVSTWRVDLLVRSLPTRKFAASLKSAATRHLNNCIMPSSLRTTDQMITFMSFSSANVHSIPTDPTTAFPIRRKQTSRMETHARPSWTTSI
jgi:hypothetical protein